MRRSKQSRRQVRSTRRSDEITDHKEYFNAKSPPRQAASVDTRTVGVAGIIMFLATNFKAEIKMIIEKIFGN